MTQKQNRKDFLSKPVFFVLFLVVTTFCLLVPDLLNLPANSLAIQGQTMEERLEQAAAQPLKSDHQIKALVNKSSSRELQVEVKIVNQDSEPSENINVEIPLLSELDSPYQHLLSEQFSHTAVVEPGDLGGRALTVKIPHLSPGESEKITLQYTILSGISDANQLQEPTEPGDLQVYLEPSPQIESDHYLVQAAVRKITGDASEEKEKLKKIYAFVLEHMNYESESPYRNKGALSALQHGKGVCLDYASLFVALSRSAGIPARVVNGYADPEGSGDIFQLDPGKEFPLTGLRHSWAEYYCTERGWLPVDPTMDIYNGPDYFHVFDSEGYIAQNYMDQSIKVSFHGGRLGVTWNESLVGR